MINQLLKLPSVLLLVAAMTFSFVPLGLASHPLREQTEKEKLKQAQKEKQASEKAEKEKLKRAEKEEKSRVKAEAAKRAQAAALQAAEAAEAQLKIQCAGIESMGLFQNNTGVAGLVEWLAKIRNNGGITKIVVYGWIDMYGQQKKGQVEIQGGQISSIRLDLTENRAIPPVKNLRLVSCQ